MELHLNLKCIIPKNNGKIHFIGIGGIGISGLAEIFYNMGYKISGSDIAYNDNINRLEKLGIEIKIGHNEENINDDIIAVVYSTAIKKNNVELLSAKDKKIPIVHRSQMYKEIARFFYTIAISGSHGKTTTTTIMSTILEFCGLDPTVINGGIINEYKSNIKLGKGNFFVIEADESDGTFIQFNSSIGIITNVDPEHLEFYENDKENLYKAFISFIENLPFYGVGIICNDNEGSRALVNRISNRKVLTYGIQHESDLMAQNIQKTDFGFRFDLKLSDRVKTGPRVIENISSPIIGMHNILNTLATILAALEIGIDIENICYALSNYKGVQRRFTKTGEVNNITIIDDYAHHPEEIKATLATAKSVIKSTNQVIAIVQPHRFSRVKNLWAEFASCFENADLILLADIYTAGEQPIENIDKENLAIEIKKNKKNIITINNEKEIAKIIKDNAKPGDLVIFLGAGNITKWAYALPDELVYLNSNDTKIEANV